MNISYSILRYFFKFFFKTFYRHHVIGCQNLPQGGAIIASNHASYWDPPLVGISCPEEIHYLARHSLFQNSFFSWALPLLNAIAVKREAGESHVLRQACGLLKKTHKIVIFPEGTRTPNGSIQPLKKGVALIAFRTECPIIPTYIHGTFEIWPKNHRWPKLRGRTSCTFGSPIWPQNYRHLSKEHAILEITKDLKVSIESLHLVRR